ncbi:MAG: U32 family peptidase, partial [Oribacterium parvum]
FVHGAMCYSYSGACFMSSLLGGRSGNRGRCAGTCRLPYTTAGKKGNFLSMKDMNTLDSLEEILKAGAYSLKIEGRMKSELYTATVVSVYRKYLDLALKGESYTVSDQDRQLLKAVYDRGGETSYLYQHNAKDMIALADRPFRKEEEELTAFLRKSMEERVRKLPLSMELRVESGAVLELSLEQEDIRIRVFGEQPVEKAKLRATAREEMEKQLLKLGNSCFYPKALRITGEEEVFIPLSALNALRREGCERVREAILAKFRRNPRNREFNGIR